MSNNEGINRDQMVTPSTDTRLETHTILETLAHLEGCSVFYGMLCKAKADSLLKRPGLHTLFVPRDEGMRRIADQGDEIEIISLLSSCLLDGAVKTADLKTRSEVETASGAKVKVSEDDAGLLFGSAKIVRPDVICSDGVIQLLDRAPEVRPAAKAAERRT
jgi:uncharacterized surface protein with fasciclin (FAS1) repeats